MSNLDSLKVLLLSGNQISSVNGLSSFIALEKLTLNDNRISDLSGIGSLKNLNFLSMSENGICDLRELSQLLKIKELHVQYNHVYNIKALSNLQNLRSLYLSHNLIRDFSFIKQLKSLQTLNLRSNCIYDENKLDQFAGYLKTRNISHSLLGQRESQPDLEALVETLFSSSSANIEFGEFLALNNYQRFVDFINSRSFDENVKSEYYKKWTSALLNDRDLIEAGFPKG